MIVKIAVHYDQQRTSKNDNNNGLLYGIYYYDVPQEDFDTENVNTHQIESYLQILENRRITLSPSSSQPEIMNVLGQLNTLRRLLSLDELPLEETMKELKDGTGK